jgi:hypothetical protein
MDYFLYLIIIITLTIFIIFFGGHNNQELIEYESNYFIGLNSIITFENKINFITNSKDKDFFKNLNYININKYLNTSNILIPNFVNCFVIKIIPHNVFNIFNLIDKSKYKTHLMVIFNHNLHNNLELIIINNNNSNINNYEMEKNIGYFYDLTKTISVVGIHHIYNNSNDNITITCFILKKPFWHC